MTNDIRVQKIKDEIDYYCNMFDEGGDFFSDDFKKELLLEIIDGYNDNALLSSIVKDYSFDDAVSIMAKIDCGESIDSAIQSIFIEEV